MKAHRSKESLVETFNQSLKEAREAFPMKLRNLLVIGQNQSIYVSEEIADHLRNNILKSVEMLEENSKNLLSNNWNGCAYRRYPFEGRTLRLLSLRHIEATPHSNKMRDAIFTLDHEIGHFVVQRGFALVKSKEHLAECAADAYAGLRSIQRFGDDQVLKEKIHERVTHITIGKSKKHYTSKTLELVKKKSKEIDVSKLSLQETATLAETIALSTYLTNIQLDKIYNAFASVKKHYTTKTTEKSRIGEIFKTMRQHKGDADIYYVSTLFLRSRMAKPKHLRVNSHAPKP